ncbi:hypothetical protein A3B02_00065 [Candidatus Roizmanbacteria bacterium RIFCSPLOWO2_01_FULL_42_14]|uniref:Uncharacterized protein n=2 Tax=Candidatus Roizmaniibacteriota TaxID=1752723 RepID=A0A1F7J8T8_9BACT|nr:MAG: hypothetical protein A3D08_00435 [Candidatus Roizmanbacteria bacterium RIFCSPHIGHO2_02_FULL_43_11]OGK52039.1 MAG: hypothetical protein A3B02_00065 [Candidatus Roizmanbacteria bacterium RIFCSPLOWO2_01_FULL_42_14]
MCEKGSFDNTYVHPHPVREGCQGAYVITAKAPEGGEDVHPCTQCGTEMPFLHVRPNVSGVFDDGDNLN